MTRRTDKLGETEWLEGQTNSEKQNDEKDRQNQRKRMTRNTERHGETDELERQTNTEKEID